MLDFLNPVFLSLINCNGTESASGETGTGAGGLFGNSSSWLLIIMLVVMVGLFFVMSIPQRKREKKVIRDFVMWFMDRDIEESLKMFGKQYNDLQSTALPDAVKRHANLYADLNDTFTKTELISLCLKKGIKSKAALIIHRWKEDDAIKEIKSETYQKTKKK